MKKLLLLLLFPVVAFGAQTISTPTEFLNSATLTIDTGSAFTIQSGVTIQLSGNIVHGVATPVSNTDAVNKLYADSLVAGAGVLWGGIGGTLSDQADLQAALDAKQNLLTIGNITDAGTDGLTITGGTAAIIGTGVALSQHVADATHNGYLSSADWNIFNGKQATLTLGNLTDTGTDGLTVTGGTGAVVGSGTTLSQHVADATHNGYLSSTDWNTFNTGLATPSALTETDDTNVTLTLGGSPATALLNATSMTLGWTGTLAVSRGGTGAATAGAHTFFGNNTGSTAAPGFQSVKDDDLSTSDIRTNDVTTSKHGFAPKGDGVVTHYLDGTGGYTAVTAGVTAPLSLKVTDSVTNTNTTILTLLHDSTGTPAANFSASLDFGLQSTTTPDRFSGRILSGWNTATDATRKSYMAFNLAGTEVARFDYAGGAGALSVGYVTNGTLPAGIVNCGGIYLASTGGNIGQFLQATGTGQPYAGSGFTLPTSASTANKLLRSDGTNLVMSVPTFPASASATANKIIKSDGINWVASTETYAAPGTSGNVLTSDGTNWLSSDVAAWTVAKVSGSDVTRTAQTLADVTGLVSATLTNATLYEFEAVLLVTTSADANGTEYGIHGAGTGTAATCNALIDYTTTSTAKGGETINGVDTATTTPAMTTASSTGTVVIKGWFTSTSTGTATLSIQHLKVTSGTSTVKVGSILKYRKA